MFHQLADIDFGSFAVRLVLVGQKENLQNQLRTEGHQVKDHADQSLGADESPCRVLGYDSDHFMISKISLN